MARSNATLDNMVITNYADNYKNMFKSSEPQTDAAATNELSVDELHPFPDHPFKLYSDERMAEMMESVQAHGVLMPILVRPREQGGYEIVAGHNRVEAAKRAGLAAVPATVRDMDNDTAIILMVDSNLRQREKILPSEKALAYKMKLEAIKRQGMRTDLTSAQFEPKLRSNEIVAEQSGESRATVQRFIRLTNLIEPLLERVDDNKMAFSPAVAVSYLSQEQQESLLRIMERDEISPSLEQAEALKGAAQKGELDYEKIHVLMSQEKPNQRKFSLTAERISTLLPERNMTPKAAEDYIIRALEYYKRHLERKREMVR